MEKTTKTIGYYISFIALGLVAASLGPTIPGLAEHTHTQLHEISFLLIFKSTKNDEPSQWRLKGEFEFSVTSGTNKVQLKTFRDTEDRIMLRYEENSSEKEASTEI